MNPAVTQELAKLERFEEEMSSAIAEALRWSEGRKQELLPHRPCVLRADCLAAINTLRTAALFGENGDTPQI